MAKLVSKTYGDALFELSMERDSMDEVLDEVTAVRQVLEQEADLGRLLSHPKISKEEKITVMEQVFKGRISDDVLGFLIIMIQKDRIGQLMETTSYVIKRVQEHKNIGEAFVTSALPVTSEQKKQIVEKLLSTTDYKAFEMKYEVDSSLIGGIIIRIGDRVVDGSIRNKLSMMAKHLSA